MKTSGTIKEKIQLLKNRINEEKRTAAVKRGNDFRRESEKFNNFCKWLAKQKNIKSELYKNLARFQVGDKEPIAITFNLGRGDDVFFYDSDYDPDSSYRRINGANNSDEIAESIIEILNQQGACIPNHSLYNKRLIAPAFNNSLVKILNRLKEDPYFVKKCKEENLELYITKDNCQLRSTFSSTKYLEIMATENGVAFVDGFYEQHKIKIHNMEELILLALILKRRPNIENYKLRNVA